MIQNQVVCRVQLGKPTPGGACVERFIQPAAVCPQVEVARLPRHRRNRASIAARRPHRAPRRNVRDRRIRRLLRAKALAEKQINENQRQNAAPDAEMEKIPQTTIQTEGSQTKEKDGKKSCMKPKRPTGLPVSLEGLQEDSQIGRASCRERV